MAGWCEEAVALLQLPAVAEMAVNVLLCTVLIWAAVMIGLVVGWSWRPRWTGLLFLYTRLRILWVWVPPGLEARRLWLACTVLSACSVVPRILSSAFRRCRGKHQDKASLDFPEVLLFLDPSYTNNKDRRGHITLDKLMHDQCLKLTNHGISACFLGSGQPDSLVEGFTQEVISSLGLELVGNDESNESGRDVPIQFNEQYKILNVPFMITENRVPDMTKLIQKLYIMEHPLAIYVVISNS